MVRAGNIEVIPAAPVDLHTHTTFSDGTLTPVELLELAAERGVVGLAITDHDTVNAYLDPNIYSAAEKLGVELVPGVEISSQDEDGRRFHVLGLLINPADQNLQTWLSELQLERVKYANSTVDLLKSNGWQVDMENTEGQTVTKAHIANAVVAHPDNNARLEQEFGRIPTRGAFIERVMNISGSCYTPRRSVHPIEAVRAIREVGGLAFLAHPVAAVYEQGVSYEEIAQKARDYDFDGIEAMYSYFHKSDADREIDETETFIAIAERLGLLVSGGSDFHGYDSRVGKTIDIGYHGRLSYPTKGVLDSLRVAAEQRRSS